MSRETQEEVSLTRDAAVNDGQYSKLQYGWKTRHRLERYIHAAEPR